MENNISGILIEDLKPLAIKYEGDDSFESMQKIAIKISVSRAARLSYNNHNGEINYEKDIKLHDQLLESKHFSPFEHIAKCPITTEEQYGEDNELLPIELGYTHSDRKGDFWSGNFKGWIQYRQLV